MKLIHWIQLGDNRSISGMMISFKELVEAEINTIGLENVGVCEVTQQEEGRVHPLNRRSIVTLPWDVALKDPEAVHVIHTYCPLALHQMKRRVFFAHGVPEYCWWEDIYGLSAPVWWQITTLLRMCDATVCWDKRGVEFWEELTDRKVQAIRRGIDLQHWTMEGTRRDFYGQNPHILYADATRLIKLPFTLLFAAKKVQKIQPNTYLRLILSDPDRDIAWSNLITRLGMEHFVPVSFGLVLDPRELYRSVDVGVSPVFWGLLSRMPLELMASGTPVICYKGLEDDPIYGERVEDSPEALAGGILRVWDKMKADPYGERLKARRFAEKQYDIRNTVKDLLKICEGVM